MDNSILLIFLLLSVSYTVEALECYACRDCQPDFWEDRTGIVTEICPRNPLDRYEKLVRCSKHVEKDGKINRGCSTLKECTRHELISKCSDDTLGNHELVETSCEICCENHLCNAAAVATISPALLAVSLALVWYALPSLFSS